MWASGDGLTGVWNVKGETISPEKPRSCNFGVWWDGDLLRELLDGNRITKWDWGRSAESPLLIAEGCVANNSTKSNPCLAADILGDWREEVIWRSRDGKELRIYSTTIPSKHRLTTLMHDPQYRLSVAWQNVGYNQPTQPGFYLGEGMKSAGSPGDLDRRTSSMIALALSIAILGLDGPPLIRSSGSGPWSSPMTWEGGQIPGKLAKVQVRAGHVVTFDLINDIPIRSIHVAGTLRFDPDRNARLTVGLLKIQDDDDPSENGAIRDAMDHEDGFHRGRATLEVGTFDEPISAGHSVTIRLAAIDGLSPDDFPAIVCLGGRMEFHGSPMTRTWLKLGAPANAGSSEVKLSDAVDGWKAGDRVIITSTRHQFAKDAARTPRISQESETEEANDPRDP